MNTPGEFTATISLLNMSTTMRRTMQKWIERAQAEGWQTRAVTTQNNNPFGEFSITFTPPSQRIAQKGEPRKVN